MAESDTGDAGPSWLNLDPFLTRLSEGLRPGQLVHGPHFSLFDSMSAVEIGNPRMDPGVHVGRQQQSGKDLDSAAPLKLTNEQVLKVADQLMAQEMSWHGGNTLAQTVFTCLYLLHPERWARPG